ncbi:TMV resistance protein N-like, partial [Prosopis cineraria]|uniref:TMV resistance protein N-like n=1 Tax=Prosopis cineraria TaxID=364024 RepID=UPI00240F3A49
MAIAIFSKNYASSTFCLDELVKIHQCVKGKNRMVLPFFYDVEPLEVRHQKGPYEQALVMHTDEEKTQNWRLALHEIANISGFHYDSRRHEYEYKFIGRIVKEISRKIERVPLYVEHPVRLDSRVSKVNSLLQIGLDDNVNMVGICGIGGLGKTTIANAVRNSIADNFESICFLNDIKENSMKLGLQGLQETMLLDILGENIKIQNSNKGVEVIKMRLKQKKLLLILDDVDKDEQLQKLAGHCNWFGDGSRIIIVTRDRHLLQRHGVERIYDMELFNDEESLELLGWNAFKGNQVESSYKEVMSSAISYAQGLPLALTVVGTQFYG